jgi:cysteine synthase
MVRQFENEAGPDIHRRTTGEEIWRDTDGTVDAVISGIGTGGTITGVGQLLKSKNPAIKIFGVEPAASPILNGGNPGPASNCKELGQTLCQAVLDRTIYDEILDADCR